MSRMPFIIQPPRTGRWGDFTCDICGCTSPRKCHKQKRHGGWCQMIGQAAAQYSGQTRVAYIERRTSERRTQEALGA